MGARLPSCATQLQTESNILPRLEQTELSNHLLITDQWLTWPKLTPLFKALQHQMNVRILDLSYNTFGIKVCEELGKILPTLTNLVALRLRCNFIKKDSLNALLLTASQSKDKMQNLEELDLSENDLGDEGMRILAKYCQLATVRASLRRLALSQCNITELPESLCELCLTHIDVSFNKLTNDTLRLLFRHLNATNLQKLYLNYAYLNCKGSIGADILSQQFVQHKFDKLRELRLNGCNLNDANFYKILNALNNGQSKYCLEILNISANTNLSDISLEYLSTKLPSLRKIIAYNCKSMFSNTKSLQILKNWCVNAEFPQCLVIEMAKEMPEYANMLEIWQTHWGKDKAKFKQLNDILYLYIDEQDICFC